MNSSAAEQQSTGAVGRRRASERPSSAVSPSSGLVGAVALGAVIVWAFVTDASPPVVMLLMLGLTATAILSWSLLVDRVHRNPSTELDWSAPRDWRVTIDIARPKIIGYLFTLIVVAATYALFPYYDAERFRIYFGLLSAALPFLLCLGPLYILWITRYMSEPKDGLWHFGKFCSGQFKVCDRAEITDHLRAWAIKAFFLAFMILIFPRMVHQLLNFDLSGFLKDPVLTASFLIHLCFVFDVCFGAIGYILTLRIFDAHIRSANPHLAAWAAALICYPPFALIGNGKPIDYSQGTRSWDFWLSGQDGILWVWGTALVFFAAIYAWATVAFGPRFSNLTHRGILTHGPYRFVKHPAYLSKNVFWWLSFLPFLSIGGPTDAVRNAALLLLVNGIYYWRAKTEERHLMSDPAYQAYCGWMADNDLFARLRALIRSAVGHPAGRGF